MQIVDGSHGVRAGSSRLSEHSGQVCLHGVGSQAFAPPRGVLLDAALQLTVLVDECL